MNASRRNVLTPVAIWLGSLSWMPRFLKQITAMDKLLSRITRERWSFARLAGLTSVMLTLVGRKSGLPRSTPVIAVPFGDEFLIAGSNFGGPKEPVWVLNIRAVEVATIRINGDEVTVVPRELEGAEREAAWTHMLKTWPNYAKYAERTGRTIPVFLLSPA